MSVSFHRWHCVTEKSEEEDEILNIKRSWEKARLKHSTPSEFLTLPSNSLGISPVPQKSPTSAHFFEEQPPQSKGRSSMLLRQRSLSTVSDPSKMLSSASRFTLPTRRLSTITGSEESTALNQTAILCETSDGKTRDSKKSQRKSQKEVMEPELKHQERPAPSVSMVKSKTKSNLQKQLVERRVRAWELRQLINIEEAMTHEMTIEEVKTWQ